MQCHEILTGFIQNAFNDRTINLCTKLKTNVHDINKSRPPFYYAKLKILILSDFMIIYPFVEMPKPARDDLQKAFDEFNPDSDLVATKYLKRISGTDFIDHIGADKEYFIDISNTEKMYEDKKSDIVKKYLPILDTATKGLLSDETYKRLTGDIKCNGKISSVSGVGTSAGVTAAQMTALSKNFVT